MNTNGNEGELSQQQEMLRQSYFWLKMVEGWQREMSRARLNDEVVKAFPELCAEVKRTTVELSRLTVKLDELHKQIGTFAVNLMNADDIDPERMLSYSLLHEQLNREGEKFRELLSVLIKLNKLSKERILC